MNWKQLALRYWLAMNASALDGAVHSCLAAGAAATIHAASPGVPEFGLKSMAILFGVAFCKGLRDYIKGHAAGAAGILKGIPGVIETAAETAAKAK